MKNRVVWPVPKVLAKIRDKIPNFDVSLYLHHFDVSSENQGTSTKKVLALEFGGQTSELTNYDKDDVMV